jgi:hypothetical protein
LFLERASEIALPHVMRVQELGKHDSSGFEFNQKDLDRRAAR